MTQEEALKILKAGKNVFLTGPAGSGKTYVLREYIQYLKDRNINVAVTASTGIAATHLGGVTIHSFSGAGINEELSAYQIDQLTQKESLAKKIQKTKVLIIDEISMIKPKLFDSLNRLIQAIKRNEEDFGGIQVVLSGDFFQLPPITRFGEETMFVDSSETWRKMDLKICYLEKQYRQTDDRLTKILDRIRAGQAPRELLQELQNECLLNKKNKEQLGDRKNGESENLCDIDELQNFELYTHNIDVDEINEKALAQIESKEYVFEAETSGRPVVAGAILKGILAPELLRLKKGASVMFVKNNFEEGYVNGTLGKVVSFDGGLPVVETFDGKIITVEKTNWEVEEDGKIIAGVMQIPLRLAWAITVHKSQGMSLDRARIDLSKTFIAGQGYVALSRLKSIDGLELVDFNDKALEIDPYVLNLDVILQKESQKWQQVINRFSEKEIERMFEDFVETSGGILNEKEIKKNRARKKEKAKSKGADKKPSHETTLEMINLGWNLNQIAEERGIKKETVVSHLEKIKEGKYFTDREWKLKIKAFKPDSKTLSEIRKVYKKELKKVGDGKEVKLVNLYRNLGGKYDFEKIRLAILFI